MTEDVVIHSFAGIGQCHKHIVARGGFRCKVAFNAYALRSNFEYAPSWHSFASIKGYVHKYLPDLIWVAQHQTCIAV